MTKVDYAKKLQQAIESKSAEELVDILQKEFGKKKCVGDYEVRNNIALQNKIKARLVVLGWGDFLEQWLPLFS